jgi:hypothetical protein
MHPVLKKTIVVTSLGAFALETYEFALQGKVGHALPSALQVAPVSSGSVADVSMGWVEFNLGNAASEAVYPKVPDSKVLKNDGQTLPSPSKAGPRS